MKFKVFFHSLALFVLLVASPLFASKSASIDDLEAVLKQAGSLEQFLASQDLQKAYLEAAQRYYGGEDKFPQESYFAILDSFRAALVEIPELADRAWRIRSVRAPIVLKSALKSYGVKPRPRAWLAFLQSLGFEFERSSSRPTLQEIREKIQMIELEIKGTEANIPKNISPRKRQDRIAAKFKVLKESELVTSTRKLILRYLSHGDALRVRLESPYGDITLNAIEEVRNRPAGFLPELAQHARSMQVALGAIPQPRTLSENAALFQRNTGFEDTTDSEYRFIDLPRRFHAIFRGLRYSECVGGSKDYLNMLTPRRFLIPLLDGGYEIHVLYNGNFDGYLSSTAVEKNGRRFLSLDVMTGEMDWKVLRPGHEPNEAPFQRRSLFALWFAQESQRTATHYEGYIVSQSLDVDNAGGLYAIRTSGPWLTGSDAGESAEYKTIDPLEAKIVSLPKPEALLRIYDTGKMIYDLTIKNASRAVRLSSTDFDEAALTNPEWLKARFSGNHFTKAITWGTYRYKISNDAEFNATLYESSWQFLQNLEPEFLEACGPSCMIGIFKTAFPSPLGAHEEFVNGLRWIKKIPVERRFNLAGAYLDWHMDEGISLALREKVPAKAFQEIKMSIAEDKTRLRVLNAAMANATNAREYLDFTTPGTVNPSDAYLDKIDKIHSANLRRFLNFKPSRNELLELRGRLRNAREIEEVSYVLILNAQSAFDLIQTFSSETIQNPSKSIVKNLDQILSDNISLFFKLKPTVYDLIRLEKNIRYSETAVETLETALNYVSSKEQFLHLASSLFRDANDFMRKKISEVIIKRIGRFLRIGATIDDIAHLAAHTADVDHSIEILHAGLPLVKTPKDYISLVTLRFEPSAKMSEAIESFVQETIGDFQKTRPWGKDWKKLKELHPNAQKPKVGMLKACIELLSRPIR